MDCVTHLELGVGAAGLLGGWQRLVEVRRHGGQLPGDGAAGGHHSHMQRIAEQQSLCDEGDCGCVTSSSTPGAL